MKDDEMTREGKLTVIYKRSLIGKEGRANRWNILVWGVELNRLRGLELSDLLVMVSRQYL